MSGELTPSQFRYTTTNNADLVIGDPTQTSLSDYTGLYIVFQTGTQPGPENNPYIGLTRSNTSSPWELNYFDGNISSTFVFANNSNVWTGSNTFTGNLIFNSLTLEGPTTISGYTSFGGTIAVGGAMTFNTSPTFPNPVTFGSSITATTITASSSFNGPGTGLTGTASSLSVGNSASLGGNSASSYALLSGATFVGPVIAPTLRGNHLGSLVSLTLPATVGSSGQYLSISGSNLVWTNPTSGTVLASTLADTTNASNGAGMVGYNDSLVYALGTVGGKLIGLNATVNYISNSYATKAALSDANTPANGAGMIGYTYPLGSVDYNVNTVGYALYRFAANFAAMNSTYPTLASLINQTSPAAGAGLVGYNSSLSYPAGSIGAVLEALSNMVTSNTHHGNANYSTPGATSWKCPDGVYKIDLILQGAGGGGGGGSTAGNTVGGGGGASGCWCKIFNILVTPGQTYTLTVGAGGTGGSSLNANGGNGGDTIFYWDYVTYIAGGGMGGISSGPALGTVSYGGYVGVHGNGGNASNPNRVLSYLGGTSTKSYTDPVYHLIISGAYGGAFGTNGQSMVSGGGVYAGGTSGGAGASSYWGGGGGASIYGVGGSSSYVNGVYTNQSGGGAGAGGAGCQAGRTGGGFGADGCIRIEY